MGGNYGLEATHRESDPPPRGVLPLRAVEAMNRKLNVIESLQEVGIQRRGRDRAWLSSSSLSPLT
jgi:hypothetical protein